MFAEKVINKIIQDKSLGNYVAYNLNPEYFMEFSEEISFIVNHFNEYNEIPSKEAMIYQFNDFKVSPIEDGWDYLIDNLQADYDYYLLKQTSDKINNLEDATQAIDLIKQYAQTIEEKKIKKVKVKDIVLGASERNEEYKRRTLVKGLTGITTGFEELDEITNGWQRGEELVTVMGRTNQGKSWISEKYLTVAWQNGEIPLLYSGEMGDFIVGARFDTLNANLNNFGILNGYDNLGTNGDSMTSEQYEIYINTLGDTNRPFYVITPKELNGKRLDNNMLVGIINALDPKPTIIGIDQYSLMSDCISHDRATKAERLENITNGLFNISCMYNIPIIGNSQAGRGATNSEDDAPEIEHAYGSDAIGQNSTRIITMRQSEDGLKIAIKKNRFGKNNVEFIYFWSINEGIFKSINKNDYVKKDKPKKTENKPTNETSDKKVKTGVDVF